MVVPRIGTLRNDFMCQPLAKEEMINQENLQTDLQNIELVNIEQNVSF